MMKRLLLGSLLGCMLIGQQASACRQNYIVDEFNVVRRNVKRENAVMPPHPFERLGQELDRCAYMAVGATVGLPVGLTAALLDDCSLSSGLGGAMLGILGGASSGSLAYTCVESLIKPLMTVYNRYAFKRDIILASGCSSKCHLRAEKAISQAIDTVSQNLWGRNNHTTESLRSALQDEKALLDAFLEARSAAEQIEDYTLRAKILQTIERGQIAYCERCNSYDGSARAPLLYTAVAAAHMLVGKPYPLPCYVYTNGHVINRLFCD
jgi:hypothetical protein